MGVRVNQAGHHDASAGIDRAAGRETPPHLGRGANRQDPPAGMPIDPGGVIRVWVSTGVNHVVVPNLVGKSLPEAKQLIMAKGLNLLLQVNNVTNEPYRELDSNGTQTKLDTYGRTMLFGASYKF